MRQRALPQLQGAGQRRAGQSTKQLAVCWRSLVSWPLPPRPSSPPTQLPACVQRTRRPVPRGAGAAQGRVLPAQQGPGAQTCWHCGLLLSKKGRSLKVPRSDAAAHPQHNQQQRYQRHPRCQPCMHALMRCLCPASRPRSTFSTFWSGRHLSGRCVGAAGQLLAAVVGALVCWQAWLVSSVSFSLASGNACHSRSAGPPPPTTAHQPACCPLPADAPRRRQLGRQSLLL